MIFSNDTAAGSFPKRCVVVGQFEIKWRRGNACISFRSHMDMGCSC
jgi:hypothetical protein